MISDLVFALVPGFAIWSLSRTKLEKGLIVILMASCLLATACGIPKFYYMVTYDFSSTDGLWNLVPEFFWCRMEEAIIIIAACAPLVKGPIERLAGRMGLPTFGIQMRSLDRVSTAVPDSDKSTFSWPAVDARSHRFVPRDDDAEEV